MIRLVCELLIHSYERVLQWKKFMKAKQKLFTN